MQAVQADDVVLHGSLHCRGLRCAGRGALHREEAGAALTCTLSSMEGTHYQRGPVIASPTLLPSIVQLACQVNRPGR